MNSFVHPSGDDHDITGLSHAGDVCDVADKANLGTRIFCRSSGIEDQY